MAGLHHAAPTDLSRTLQVIGAGYPRTGTTSFVLALEILLGAPVLHSGSACLAREEPFIKTWIDVLNAPEGDREVVRKKLRSLTAGYVGIADSPGVLFVEEFLEEFPESIVIATQRDPARWWKSFDAVASTVFLLKGLNLLLQPLPAVRYFSRWIDAMTYRHAVLYGGGKQHKMGPNHLEEHNQYLRRVTPPERLHFFNVKDGWEPLCKILNKPIPDVPFPHANDADAVQELMTGLIKQAIGRWIGLFAALGVTVWFVRRVL